VTGNTVRLRVITGVIGPTTLPASRRIGQRQIIAMAGTSRPSGGCRDECFQRCLARRGGPLEDVDYVCRLDEAGIREQGTAAIIRGIGMQQVLLETRPLALSFLVCLRCQSMKDLAGRNQSANCWLIAAARGNRRSALCRPTDVRIDVCDGHVIIGFSTQFSNGDCSTSATINFLSSVAAHSQVCS
jgi:hypothetical protein